MLSVFVGNGAQLCAMTGVTLGLLDHRCSEMATLTSHSVRAIRISISIKPRLHRHCHDGLLDILWRVSTLVVCQNTGSLIFWDCRVSGYIASRVYGSLGGTEKRKLAFLTATILPT